MNTFPPIIIEGPDGIGKTTLANGIARNLGGKYYKTPGCRNPEQRAQYDKANISVTDRFQFYLTACREDIQIIQDMQSKGDMVVCDRLLASTIAHHQAMDETIDITDALAASESITPKIQILLTAKQEVILQRLSMRPTRTRFETDRDLLQRTQERFLAIMSYDLIIDNTTLSIEETLGRATDFLTHQLKP